MLIYGSTAIKHWFPDYSKSPKDLDIISQDKTLKKEGVEVYWIPEFQYVVDNNKDKTYVDPDLLYTIKVSHAAWDINWVKHTKDIHFLQEKGCKLNKELYDLLVSAWTRVHGKKHFSFNKEHKELFKDSVNRAYNHDDLHEILKLNDVPLYKKILKDNNKALCSYEKFTHLSDKEQFELALEEVVVVAYERYVLPGRLPFKQAVPKALQDLITRMTRGWYNLLLIQNSSRIIHMNESYFNYFMTKGSKL
jgi:hypothetical protein